VEWGKHLKEGESSTLGIGTTELQAASGSSTLNRAQRVRRPRAVWAS